MKRNLIWAMSLFILQPSLILGLIVSFYNYKKRVNYSRNNFRVNFIRGNFEIKDYFLKGLLPGIISSILVVGLGIPITIEWFLIYQLITIVLLVISGSRFIHPIFTFPISILSMYLLRFLNVDWSVSFLTKRLNKNIFTTDFPAPGISTIGLNVLLLSVIILFLTILFMKNKNENKYFPFMKTSNRGKAVAMYQNKVLWLMPLFVIIPGKVFGSLASWWPLFEIGGEQYAFLILPILVGFHYKISTQFIEEATKTIKKEFGYLAIIGLILTGGAFYYQKLTPVLAGVLLTGSLLILFRHYRREKSWPYQYGPVSEGIRIISVRPESPAERMGLMVGDVILNMNNHEINNQKEFDEIVAYNRSYISMRVERKDGELIIAETPLYDDDYNNLGLLILEK